MANITTYRTGQAAKILEVSSHQLRLLCEAGAIEAELSAGNQWRIHASEVERLRKEGVPPIPRVMESEANPARPRQTAATPAESEAVQKERESVEIAQSQLQKRQLHYQLAEVDDRFRARARKEEESRQAGARAAWLKRWREQAGESLPRDVSPAVRLRTIDGVEVVLCKIGPEHPQGLQKELVQAAIDQGLQPYYREKAIEQALRTIPREHHAFARSQATTALDALSPDAQAPSMNSAAAEAVQGILIALQHLKDREQVMSSLTITLSGMSQAETEEATQDVISAMDLMPVGCGFWTLYRAKDLAIEPIQQRAKQRKFEEQQQTNAAAAQMRSAVEHTALTEMALICVAPYVAKFEFDSRSEESAEVERLVKELRPEVLRRFASGKFKTSEDAKNFIHNWIEEEI